MARKIIDIGAVGNDGTGDSIRDSFRKVNDNFRELYSSLGLGERLSFRGLSDTPDEFDGFENAIVTVNNTESGLEFRNLIAGPGITVDLGTANQMTISSAFQTISADPNPQLGGNLSARSGGNQWRIKDLVTPVTSDEAVNKGYADTKISLAGVDAIDPATGLKKESFGQMTGPLILSRDPEADDDEIWSGLVAATKRYVDTSAFGSTINLYVATSGQDDRTNITPQTQGRALAYAFRTIEGALKRAEEIMLDSRIELGPYKKVLTYNEGEGPCTLDQITIAPNAGSGFSGQVLMSVDTIAVNATGVNYAAGDILTLVGGTFIEPARFEILATTTASLGGVLTLRQITSGVYSSLPGSTGVLTSSNSGFGNGATVNVTYKVNRVDILDRGSDYGLVSVRIVGGGGTGAFGTADVVGGGIQSITVTDQGTGFTTLPNVLVNLPRFLIDTKGYRTDFTGDVINDTDEAVRSRDLREGLYLRGETSGALAQILAHDGSLIGDNEVFDVDIQYGNFVEGEIISYGDVTRQTQISVLVESGIYEENLPLKVPQNVSIVGDEFRRVIIRPKAGNSSSPWASINFRRDQVIDGMTVVDSEYGYHYLTDPSKPVYPAINNKGRYRAAAELLKLNRQFIQKETIAWIDSRKTNNIAPFSIAFIYNKTQYEKSIGLLIDSIIFDLKWGGSNRTVSEGLKYFDLNSDRIDLSSDLIQLTSVVEKVEDLAQTIIKNQQISDLFQTAFVQIIDNAFNAESGSGITTFAITDATNTNPVVITSQSPHRSVNGDIIRIVDVGGMTELNGNDYYVTVLTDTTLALYSDKGLKTSVNGVAFGVYTEGGAATNQGGVLGALFNSFIETVNQDTNINIPLPSGSMDMFLCNDAVRFQAVTMQGQGGFAMVLDPTGQVRSKSPYAQECSSFSRSTGRQTFAGGMFIDGFSGNLKFKILGKAEIDVNQLRPGRSYTIKTVGDTDFTLIGALTNTVGEVFIATAAGVGTGTAEDNSFLRVGELHRFPQLPASFIVNDVVYRINYVRDFSYNAEGSTASFILDETTPWTFPLIEYNEDICERDVGLIIDGLSYDIVFGSNYHARKSGLLYRQANASEVVGKQLDITVEGINKAHELAEAVVESSELAAETVRNSNTEIKTIVRNGTVFATPLSLPSPTGINSDVEKAKNQLLNNTDYIIAETIGWINAQITNNLSPFSTIFTYDFVKYSNYFQFILNAVSYDITYGGNTQVRDIAIKFYDGVGDAVVLQLSAGEVDKFLAAITYLKYLCSQIVRNLNPAVNYSALSRVTGDASTLAVANDIGTRIDVIPTVISGGVSAAPTIVLPDLGAYPYDNTLKTLRTTLLSNKTAIQTETITFVGSVVNQYEVLMPGNRSMLGNDFTQINDMGYGVVATNGGLCEVVSVYTYYNYTSYYSINGGQIRSVSGSSAHGVYALVAEGSDPLEIPRPITLFHELSQGAECYYPSASFANSTGGLTIFVTNYSYLPVINSELEIDHGLGSIYKYPVSGVTTDSLPVGVAKLSLKASEGVGVEGLAATVPDGTKLTIRMNSTVVLTGDVSRVPTRPSTGLIINGSTDVYRILQFGEYSDPTGNKTVTITTGSPATISRLNHGLKPDYQIKFITTGTLPSGIVANQMYYVLPEGFTNNSFRISTVRRGSPIAATGVQGGIHSYTIVGLSEAVLRENYNYVDVSIWPMQPYVTVGSLCTLTIANPGVVNLTGHGFLAGTVIRFETEGDLPEGILTSRHYWVENVIGPDSFTITDVPGGSAIAFTGTQNGNHYVGAVVGRAGDSEFAIVGLGEVDRPRVINSKFVWIGEEYTVVGYQSANETGEDYSLITLNKPLVDSVINYSGLPTLRAGVPKATNGTLTVRISLTRVTSHDLLDIGTGSYADTNYPSEIYGSPVNPYTQSQETVERNTGRVFYATTDQFGNFSVGPYFRVDQGTGTVTFAASIALTNLDGIGFKRGVAISEFSIDSSMSRNEPDIVPTEIATRRYIERRLGLSHDGNNIVDSVDLIPPLTGGYLALSGKLAMKADLDVGDNKVFRLSDPTNPQDAVNLRSLTFDNFQDITLSTVEAADLLAFSGTGEEAKNYSVTGDISLTISATPNTIDAQIVSGSIVNTDINSSANIAQSKLSLNAAATRADATGITQADRGLASFDNSQFSATDGWISIKDNGIALGKVSQIATKTVLGNSAISTANVSAIAFSTVVNDGGAIKKSQYSDGTGYLKRISTTFNSDADYDVFDDSTDADGDTLVKRDTNGDFAARRIDLERLLVDGVTALDTTTSASGGYTVLYGFAGQSGVLIGDGTQATDKVSLYYNNSHRFRNREGTADAPVSTGTLTASSVSTTSITSGGATTEGTLTGAWKLPTTSGITFESGTLNMGTGTIDAASATVKTRVLTTGASTTTGTITGYWSLTTGSRLEATYADLAEYYEADKDYDVGTVLVFGGDKEVTLSTKSGDYRVAGVVSDNAAYIMNKDCQGVRACIALQGRVKCRVVGKIAKGDLMITSNIAGVAISAKGQATAGTIIGKALADYDSDHIGLIEIAVGRT